MNIIRLKDTANQQYEDFKSLYAKSFPEFEQRTQEQQNLAFASPHYHLDLYYKNDIFVGFIAYWQFDLYAYIEHFAIHDMHRGCGYGSELLNQFIKAQSQQVILEIDPIVDEISAARWRFYERCGLNQNIYTHTHPPYRAGNTGHSLVVLSSFNTLTPELYELFNSDLYNIVMHF